jgi:cell division septation protein DedD
VRTFTFTASRFRIMIVCLFMLLVMTFAAGMLTGVGMWAPTQTELAELKRARSRTAAVPSGAEMPQTAALRQPHDPQLPAAAASPAPGAETPPAAAAPAAAAPPAEGKQPSALLALAGKPAALDESQNIPGSGYVLQVGSFRDARNATQIVTELKEKGFTPLVRKSTDSADRTWHVIQVGPYADLNTAVRAARDFSGATSVHAFIRRVEP